MEAHVRIQNIGRFEVSMGDHHVGSRLPYGGHLVRNVKDARKRVAKVRMPIQPSASGSMQPSVPSCSLKEAKPLACRRQVRIFIVKAMKVRHRPTEPAPRTSIELQEAVIQPL